MLASCARAQSWELVSDVIAECLERPYVWPCSDVHFEKLQQADTASVATAGMSVPGSTRGGASAERGASDRSERRAAERSARLAAAVEEGTELLNQGAPPAPENLRCEPVSCRVLSRVLASLPSPEQVSASILPSLFPSSCWAKGGLPKVF